MQIPSAVYTSSITKIKNVNVPDWSNITFLNIGCLSISGQTVSDLIEMDEGKEIFSWDKTVVDCLTARRCR